MAKTKANDKGTGSFVVPRHYEKGRLNPRTTGDLDHICGGMANQRLRQTDRNILIFYNIFFYI